ncbi:MAG TPA: MFS transporter, partial [Propionibacteriaceae bacterium]|nr:MFS transporter [Propionibacteriaceae bacterium]
MTTPQHDESPPDPARWRALAICLVAAAMTLLDLSIVNVALPSLRQSLGADDSDLQWIVAGYALAFGVVLVPAGRLGDARSRRTIFLVGIALFTVSSAVAGAAPNPTVLAVARVVQGLAGGLIAPQTSAFVQNLFRGPERARAFGLLGASIGVSTAIGPLLGGLLVNLGGPDFGWRLVFYVNVPIGIALLPLAYRLLPVNIPARQRQSLDPVGVGLFVAAILLILLPLVEGRQDQPLADRPWWLAIPALVLLAVCWLWERFWSGRGR